MSTSVRPAAVAGLFYPRDPRELARLVDRLLDDAAAARPGGQGPEGSRVEGEDEPVKGVIAPHAGYAYSGPVAASAYLRLRPERGTVSRVVLLGPTHRAYVRGLALPGADAFETPLGRVPVDADAVARIASLPQVVTSPGAHAQEHSLEVHLPFLQRLFGPDFTLLPLAVGEATPDEVAEVLERLWGGPETKIVISSDLSHFLGYRDAYRVDRATADRIVHLEPVVGEQACGARPVNGLLALARRRDLSLELVDLRSSGDTAGGRDEVVGYGAFLVHEAAASVRESERGGVA